FSIYIFHLLETTFPCDETIKAKGEAIKKIRDTSGNQPSNITPAKLMPAQIICARENFTYN
ncbi:MAG: hypothetical protein JSU78_00840, partial [Deltaproteobacteria bacterium]